VVVIGLSLLFVLVTGKYAYDSNALGARTSGVVAAVVWAVSVLRHPGPAGRRAGSLALARRCVRPDALV